MRKFPWLGAAAAGFLAGSVAGLFGAGGGMVLVPLLTVLTDLKDAEVFPASVSIILPICVVSLLLTARYTQLPIRDAVPFLLGSVAGGFAAGKWGEKIPVNFLHRALGILILWGGYRYLC